MGLFIEKPTPFIPEFLNRMMQSEYPKKRIDLLVHNTVGLLSAKQGTFGLCELRLQDRKEESETRLMTCRKDSKILRLYSTVSETGNFPLRMSNPSFLN